MSEKKRDDEEEKCDRQDSVNHYGDLNGHVHMIWTSVESFTLPDCTQCGKWINERLVNVRVDRIECQLSYTCVYMLIFRANLYRFFFSTYAVWFCGCASVISYGFEFKLTFACLWRAKNSKAVTETVDKLSTRPQCEWWNDLRFSNKTKTRINLLIACLLVVCMRSFYL